jgi:GntR family transcriptional regulator/MocR family aminotransferase
MLTYELKKAPGVPLYEALYRCIRSDILSGKLAAGEKLPSKRALAAHLEVSKITVETAYSQLAAEGYVEAREKVGYFVEKVETAAVSPEMSKPLSVPAPRDYAVDLTANTPAKFPFSVWTRLQREVTLDFGHQLLEPVPHQGVSALRQAIADHLAGFRGMQVDPENIIIGAGTDFLYNLLLQLLGQDRVYALEEPGYGKIRRIYDAAGAKSIPAPMDSAGVMVEAIDQADVLHISPSHHFPTGLIMPMQRRQALLRWAEKGEKWIIEDDYDSEFRFDAHPMSAMYSPLPEGRVIYMNSFSKSLAPSIRMGYMVLPPKLMAAFRKKLDFYSCTVSGFEQHTLARFLSEGHFEKHINRMRKFYRSRRNRLLQLLKSCSWAQKLTIEEADAGLHFLVQVDTDLSDEMLERFCGEKGLRVRCLSRYYDGTPPRESLHKIVVNYSGLRDEDLDKLAEILGR